MRFSTRSKVDLPHPDGPMKALIERSASVMLMLCSDCTSP